MDNLTALKVFRTVVEQGSFAAAARKLGLSPAAISKNINELEAHLSVGLLNRTTRRMSLTEAGANYFERITRVLDDLAEADATMGSMRDMPKGLLRVSAPMTVTLVCLSSAIPRFLEMYPDVSIDLNLNDRRINIVEEGFDVVIRGTDNLEDSGLIARKLMTMDHVLCGSPAYFERHGEPETPRELAQHSFVQFSLSDHANEYTFQKEAEEVSVPINGRYKVSSSLAVRDALRDGFGMSLIPRVYVQEDLENGRLRSVLSDWSANETILYAVYPSKRYVVSKVRAFLDFLIEEFRDR